MRSGLWRGLTRCVAGKMAAPTIHTERLTLRQLRLSDAAALHGERETHIGVRDSLIFGLLADEWVQS
jgi:hypothetical protein